MHFQVNSDKIYWQRNLDGTFKQIFSEKKAVGHSISTKAVGSDERFDITHLYKHPEGIIKLSADNKGDHKHSGYIKLGWHFLWFSGSEQERIAVETACRYGSKAEAYSSPTAEDVSVKVTMDGEGPKMGSDAELTITLQNSSSENRKVSLHSQAAVMYYTGVHKATVIKDKADIDLLPNEGEWNFFSGFSGRWCMCWNPGLFLAMLHLMDESLLSGQKVYIFHPDWNISVHNVNTRNT